MATLLLACLAVLGGPRVRGQAPLYLGGGWNPEGLGNHRAVVMAPTASAVRVHLDWQRRDPEPASTLIIVVDARSGRRLTNVVPLKVTGPSGDIAFEPVSGPGEYYVYFVPYVTTGRSNYPTVVYPKAEATAEAGWLTRNQLTPEALAGGAWQRLPEATVLGLQSVDDHSRFTVMEAPASPSEVERLVASAGRAGYLLFAEDRERSIRMTSQLPARWAASGPGRPFEGTAQRGEFYAFQVGIYALEAVSNLAVQFSDLRGPGTTIPAAAFKSFNTGGVDWMGRPMAKVVAVPAAHVQPLWMGVQVPDNALPGDYSGLVTVTPAGRPATSITITIHVADRTIAAAGDDEPWRMSRLRWLDSTLAQDDTLVKPYTPVTVNGRTISVLGRDVDLGEDGWPAAIRSRFTPEMTSIGTTSRPVLAAPIGFTVQEAGGRAARALGKGVRITKQAAGAASWESRATAGAVTFDTHAQMEFDGNIEFSVAVTASKPIALDDIRLDMPMARDTAVYMMGLNAKGGRRPARYDWMWDVKHNQDAVWIGDVNAGLQLSLKDDKYVRPLNTNFYLSKPLVMPASWENGGKGGCHFSEQGTTTFLASCYSGARHLAPGEVLHYDFRLLVTPFHPLDTNAQWATRYYHAYKPLKDVMATGANTINVHHATEINPYINYPFLRPAEMKGYIDQAHASGLKVKIYYTVRELSNRAAELFALRSLGDEVLSDGPGGGYSWLQEHLGANYIAAWFVPELRDAAVINSGVSRWHNYYVEGLNWLVRNVGIDGLYIDDVAFDRTTMKRVRKVLDAKGEPGLIDLHSANQYNPRDGFASSANLYLEHFPFLSRIWFGEYFDYNASPDYWLVEMSGVPFGVMGEMLEGGGNAWRGMVFGMTARLPWAGDPRPVWKAWDAFGMKDARMIGWWVPNAPVKTGRDDVLATAYVKDGKAMIALASWAKESVEVRLGIDTVGLGVKVDSPLVAPAIDAFQPAATFQPGQPIRVEPGRGWLLVVGG